MRILVKPDPIRLPFFEVPKLHRVAVGKYSEIQKIYNTYHCSDLELIIINGLKKWCKENCVDNYYFIPSWTNTIGCDFADTDDAFIFKLVWHERLFDLIANR